MGDDVTLLRHAGLAPEEYHIANKAAFDKLDKATQDAVLKAAAQAEERGWKMSQDKNAWYVEQLKSHGMKVAPPGDTLKAGLETDGRSAHGRLAQARRSRRAGGDRRV